MPTALPPPDLLSVFNALPGATMLLAPDLRIAAASDAYLAATLTQRDTLVGQFLFDAFPDNPDAPDAHATRNLRASLETVLATGQPHEMAPQHYDVPDPTRPGHFVERHWLPHNTPVLGPDGQVQYIIHIAADVTAGHQARQQLRDAQAAEHAARAEAEQQRQRFRDVLEQLPAFVAVYHGPDHIYQFVNPPYQSRFPHRSFLGKPFREGTPEAVELGVVAIFDRVYQTGEPFHLREMEGWFDFDGTGQPQQIFLNLFFHPLRDAQGRITGVLDFSYDVTEQVRARRQVEQLNQELEAARAEAEAERERLHQVLMRMPANIALLRGPEHVYDLVNPSFEQLFPARTPLGLSMREAIPELDGQGFYELFDRVYETGEPFYDAETEAWADFAGTGALQRRYYRTAFEPIRDAQGRVTEVLNFAVDVTAQVEARHQVEQLNRALEAERALLRALLTQAPLSIGLFTGDDLQVVAVSTVLADAVGSTVGQLVGRPLLEGVPELRGQGIDAALRQVMATQVPVHETELPAVTRRAGELHTGYYNAVYQPLYAADGHCTGVMSVAAEVTEQVRARQQVEQLNQGLEERVEARTREALALQADLLAATRQQAAEREAFYQVFEQTTAVVALLRGANHRYEYVNPAYQAFFPDQQLVGLPVVEAVPELFAQGFGDLLDNVYRTGETFFGAELPFVFPAREDQPEHVVYFNFTYQAYHEAGRVAGVTIFAFDVTGQVLARQARETQQHELTALFEQAPVAIAVFRGPQYVIEQANSSVCALWGRTQQQALGTPLFELLPEVAGQGFEQLLDQVRTTGEPFVAHELPSLIDRHGRRETVYWNFVYAPLREADGRIERVTVVASDGTEQVLARQQVLALNQALQASNQDLNASNNQLTRTNVDLDNFIYTASHDLKAPISNIEGLLLALEQELPPAGRVGDVPQMLELMQDSVNRFKRTIDHLTDVSRLQKEHSQPSHQVSLAAVIAEVELDLAPLLAASRARLDVQVAECPPVTFSEKNLRSVVYNLLSNALKYRHPDRVPEVRVRCRSEQGYLALDVHDNGLGLDLARGQEQLFGMFQRLHTHVEGTGIGLYMVKRMLENAGGRIEVRSQLGQGSTFTVYLPR